MQIAFHDYLLKFCGSSQCKEGSLVRCIFEDKLVGYADCLPIVSQGDLSLKEQKKRLLDGNFTPLTEKTVLFAKLDALARFEKRSLLDASKGVKSHFLIMNLHQPQNWEAIAKRGFTILKIKLQGTDSEKKALQGLPREAPNFKWRLDFNSKMTYESFTSFIHSLDLSFIDFIEDPFPYNEYLWQKVEKDFQLSLAADFEKKKLKEWHPQVLIIKPAVDAVAQFKGSASRIVITSYLAHPLEQVAASYCAQQLQNDEIMGLHSHTVFEPNIFSSAFNKEPSLFFAALGTGFGFNHHLANLEWK
ncbi:Uncharacterized protein PHSC3_000350 [Chlamydiales bacterium STE3]|nr:Uncharacterized protein PHSC3_000350 [Chlamydiales bacterium STE3]